MPRIFKIGGYLVYFWSNENSPLEPVHVHVSKGIPSEGTAKIWITRSGRCYCVIITLISRKLVNWQKN